MSHVSGLPNVAWCVFCLTIAQCVCLCVFSGTSTTADVIFSKMPGAPPFLFPLFSMRLVFCADEFV